MTTPFSDEEVIKRTARRLGTNDTRVRDFLHAYSDEWLKLAQETRYEYSQYAQRAEAEAAEAPAKAAGKARSPRKAPAKGKTPAKSRKPAQGDSAREALGNALVDSLVRREAEASVKLDGETQTVGEPMNSSDTTTPDVPDGTPPPPSECARVTADELADTQS